MIKYITRPLFYAKLVGYFLFGKIFARLLFPSLDLNSRWFCSPGADGWKWIWSSFIWQKIGGINQKTPWPVSHLIIVVKSENIKFHMDDLNNFQMMGNYFQGCGKIIIGQGCYIASNVGMITQNHDLDNLDQRSEPKDIVLGKNCWIGMNSVILPGVVLGEKTIVGAGSVVTKSFLEGYCVIAGNPAKKIKDLNKNI